MSLHTLHIQEKKQDEFLFKKGNSTLKTGNKKQDNMECMNYTN